MKIRSGFVSNSSSSSFVVVGTTMKKKELEKRGWWDEEWGGPNEGEGVLPEDIEIYYTEDDYIVGEAIVDCEDWGMDSADFTEAQLKEIFKRVSKKLDCPVKLMMGTRPT